MKGITLSLTVFLFLLAPPAVVSAQEKSAGDSPDGSLGRVVVTAKRSGVYYSDVSETLAVLDREDLAYSPGTHLADALQYVPGVDIEPRSGQGQATALTIQGADSRQVRVMVDGIPINSPSSGQANLSVLPTRNIDRVEIIKGPGSSAWGSALGGVVNVLTRDPAPSRIPHGSVTTTYGGYGTTGDSFDLSGTAGALGYYLMGDYRDSGGTARGDTLEKKSFNKLTYSLPDDGKLTALFGYSMGDINSGKFPDGSWNAQPYRARYGKVGFEDDFNGTGVQLELKHSRQDSATRMFSELEAINEPFVINTRDRVYEGSAVVSRGFRGRDTLVMGADYDYNLFKSDVYLPQAKSLYAAAPYANYTFVAGRWDFIAGGRYDYNSEFGKEFSPSGGVVYHFDDPARSLARFKVSRAFNAPPLLWRYNDNPLMGAAPNPDIHAERGIVYQMEGETSPVGRVRLKGSVYRADIREALAPSEVSPGIAMVRNFEKFRRQGAELEARVKIIRGLSVLAAAEFNDVENRVTRATVRGGGKPRHGFDLGLEYANSRGLLIGIKGYYKRWNQPASAQPNDRKFIADARASQQLGKNVNIFLSLYNITNSAYWADQYYPIRKRYLEGGLTISW